MSDALPEKVSAPEAAAVYVHVNTPEAPGARERVAGVGPLAKVASAGLFNVKAEGVIVAVIEPSLFCTVIFTVIVPPVATLGGSAMIFTRSFAKFVLRSTLVPNLSYPATVSITRTGSPE